MFNNKKFPILFLSVMLVFVVAVPLFVSATPGNPDESTTGAGDETTTGAGRTTASSPLKIEIKNPFNCAGQTGANCTIVTLLNTIIDKVLIPIGAVVAVLMIMYAGFLFVTAGGDTKKVTDARNALLYACIGAAVLLGAKVLSLAIQETIKQL